MTDPIVGFTCSAFDLLHAGHVLMLKECKRNCDKLIVGLQTDPSVDRPDEKNKPVQGYFERYIQLDAIKYVDEICPYELENDLVQLLDYVKPDIRFLGDDWHGKPYTGEPRFKSKGPKVHYTKRYEYSTSELKARIRRAL